MKKIATLFLLATAFVLAACTSDDSLTAQSGERVTVSYTVALPEYISTRTYSDGKTAVYLSYGVYESGTTNLVLSEERAAIIDNKAATVEMQLLKDNEYDIVFWADGGKGSDYKIDFENQIVAMNYDAENTTDDDKTYNVAANNEKRDAFWAAKTGVKASSSANETITLTRPFAQLNFGTDDLRTEAIRQSYTISQTYFTLTMPAGSLANTFNLKDGSVSNATSSATTFVYKGVPATSEGEFPVSDYDYLQMNYLLPYVDTDSESNSSAADKTIVGSDVTLVAALSESVQPTVSVSNMPLQRNYRTNIYGSLLTNPTKYILTISEDYDAHYCIKDGVLYYCVENANDLKTAITDSQPAILLKADIDTTMVAALTLKTGTLINLNDHKLSLTRSGAGYVITSANGLEIINGSLDITSTVAGSPTGGISVSGGILTMDNVEMTITASNASQLYSVYYSGSEESTITNSTITATGNDACGAYNNSTGTIGIANSTITVVDTGGSASGAHGAYNNNSTGTIVIDDCEITVTSSSTTTNTYGTRNNSGTIEISGCKITATNNYASSNAYEVHGVYNVDGGTTTIKDSEVTATGTYCAYGMNNGGSCNMTIEGCTITAIVTEEDGTAYGVSNSSGTVTMSNSKIIVKGANTSEIVNNNGKMTIDGEELS